MIDVNSKNEAKKIYLVCNTSLFVIPCSAFDIISNETVCLL
jgi:hypothetical protein